MRGLSQAQYEEAYRSLSAAGNRRSHRKPRRRRRVHDAELQISWHWKTVKNDAYHLLRHF